ncbi:hypothetical protein M2322_003722 [Rhodoblastus acidophilus]|nr:hypothetical protein [Rhodoblastus acidophilus]
MHGPLSVKRGLRDLAQGPDFAWGRLGVVSASAPLDYVYMSIRDQRLNDPLPYWKSKAADRFTVHKISGDHCSVVQPPTVVSVARGDEIFSRPPVRRSSETADLPDAARFVG